MAGCTLVNFVPHFVKGICGDKFPTPFSKPAGRGPSSPTVNVAWGLFNLLLGYMFYRLGKVSAQDTVSLVLLFAGAAILSLMLSKNFEKKERC